VGHRYPLYLIAHFSAKSRRVTLDNKEANPSLHLHQLDFELFGHVEDALVAVKLPIDHSFDPRVGNAFEAIPAGRSGDVDTRVVDRRPVFCRLNNRVDLGVDGAHAMAVFNHVADFIAVCQAANRAVISRGENRPVAYDYRSDALSVAGRPLGHLGRDVHEVLVPGNAF
jgi:hypothetical protein